MTTPSDQPQRPGPPDVQGTIDEFRANGGRVGGRFEGTSLLLLHHVGAKSGIERVNPLMYVAVGTGYAVFASKGGSDTNPGWYHNMQANPEATVEVGTETRSVRAREAEGDEYDRLWVEGLKVMPMMSQLVANSARSALPIVVLERR